MADLFQLPGSYSRRIVFAALLYKRWHHLQNKKKKRVWWRQWLARREQLRVGSRLVQAFVLEVSEGAKTEAVLRPSLLAPSAAMLGGRERAAAAAAPSSPRPGNKRLAHTILSLTPSFSYL